MINNPTFTSPALHEQWPGTTDIDLTFTIGHEGFPNLYVFAIGPLGSIQIGIHQVSYKHALNLINSHWFIRALPAWLKSRVKQEMGFHYAYLGRLPSTVTFSKGGDDVNIAAIRQVEYIDTTTL